MARFSISFFGSPSDLLEGLRSHFQEEVFEITHSTSSMNESGDLIIE